MQFGAFLNLPLGPSRNPRRGKGKGRGSGTRRQAKRRGRQRGGRSTSLFAPAPSVAIPGVPAPPPPVTSPNTSGHGAFRQKDYDVARQKWADECGANYWARVGNLVSGLGGVIATAVAAGINAVAYVFTLGDGWDLAGDAMEHWWNFTVGQAQQFNSHPDPAEPMMEDFYG